MIVTTVMVALAILNSNQGRGAEILANTIHEAAETDCVNPLVVVAIIEKESNFRSWVVSKDGKDVGLMGVRLTGAGAGFSVAQLKDPETNVSVGTRYLAERVKTCRRLIGALSDYHAGPGNRCAPNAYGLEVLKRFRRLQRLTERNP